MATTVGPHGGTAPLSSLVTVFNPPCPTSWLVTTTKVPSQYPTFPSAAPQASCDPPQWDLNLDDQGFQYYSPAICPGGFSVGQNCGIVGRTRTLEGFPAVESGETVMWCVPSGMACTSDITDFRGGIWGIMTTATTPGALATVGPAIQIRWRDVDLTALETHPLTPGLRPGGGSNTADVPRPGPGPPQSPQQQPQQKTLTTPTAAATLEVFSTIARPTLFPAVSGSAAATSTPPRPGSTTESNIRPESPSPTTSTSTSADRPAPTNSAPGIPASFLPIASATGPLAVIILSSVLSGILLLILAFVLLRRRLLARRSRIDDSSAWNSPSRQVGLGVWLRSPGGGRETPLAGRSYGARTGRGSGQTPILGLIDVAIGGKPAATGPYGTVGNPAEPVDERAVEADVAANASIHEEPIYGNRARRADSGEEEEPDNRASWVSRVFRARRSWLFPPLSPASLATGTTVTNARSDSRVSRSSRWTERTASGGDWEVFVRECKSGGMVAGGILPGVPGGWSWDVDPKGKGKELTAALTGLQKPENAKVGGAGMGPQLGPEERQVRRGALGENMAMKEKTEKGKEKGKEPERQDEEEVDPGLLRPGLWGGASSAEYRFSFDRLSEGTFGRERLSGDAVATGS